MGVDFEDSRCFLPSLHDGLIWRFPPRRFVVLGKIEGVYEARHMLLETFQISVVKALMVRFNRSACPFVHG